MPPRHVAPRECSSGMTSPFASSVGHARQTRPSSENSLSRHGSHVAALALGLWPFLHAVQLAAPREETAPGGHGRHAVRSGTLRVPAAHTKAGRAAASGLGAFLFNPRYKGDAAADLKKELRKKGIAGDLGTAVPKEAP